MTFNFRNTITGQFQKVSARGDAHAWGLMLWGHGDNVKDWELVGASHFGRVLWGEI